MRVLVDIGNTELDLTVDEDTDFDGTFVGTCNDTGERLKVNGWLAEEVTHVHDTY